MSVVCVLTSSAALFQFVTGVIKNSNNVIGRLCLGCTSQDEAWSDSQLLWYCQPYLVYCFYVGSVGMVLCQVSVTYIYIFHVCVVRGLI